jgi:hypothetical protein
MTEQNSSISARQLFTDFMEDFLQIKFVGFQRGFGIRPDMILFRGVCGSMLAIPTSTLHEPRERARQIVQEKLTANAAAFDQAIDSESVQAIDRFFTAHSLKAVRKTNVGKVVAALEAA